MRRQLQDRHHPAIGVALLDRRQDLTVRQTAPLTRLALTPHSKIEALDVPGGSRLCIVVGKLCCAMGNSGKLSVGWRQCSPVWQRHRIRTVDGLNKVPVMKHNWYHACGSRGRQLRRDPCKQTSMAVYQAHMQPGRFCHLHTQDFHVVMR